MKVSPFVWSLGTRIIQQGLSFANTIILAHFLCPEEFGKVGVLAIFTHLATLLADTGMGGSLIKEKNVEKIDCSTVFVYNLTLSIVLYLILFFCAPLFESYFDIEGLTRISRWVTLPFVINAMAIVPRSLCMKRLEFNKIFYVTTTATVVSMIVAAIMAICGCGVWALITYNIVLAVIDNVGYHIVGHYVPSFRFRFASFKRLFSFGLFTALSTVVDTVYENILSVLLGRNVGTTQVGYYTQARKLENAPSQALCVTVSSVAFPVLSKLVDDKEAFKKRAQNIQTLLMTVSVPIMLILCVFATPIIKFLLGAQWEPAGHYLAILSLVGIFKILETTNRTFIKSAGRADTMFYISLLKRSVGIAVLFLAMRLGIEYLLWAYVLTSAFCALVNSAALAKVSSYHFLGQMKNWLQVFLPCGLLYLALFFINRLHMGLIPVFLLVLAALVVFYAILPLFGINDVKTVVNPRLKAIRNKLSK